MGKRYVVPRKLTGIVPEMWRRRAEVPLGNAIVASKLSQHRLWMQRVEDVCVLWTSVLGDSDGYWDSACATSLYVRLTSWYSCSGGGEGSAT